MKNQNPQTIHSTSSLKRAKQKKHIIAVLFTKKKSLMKLEILTFGSLQELRQDSHLRDHQLLPIDQIASLGTIFPSTVSK